VTLFWIPHHQNQLGEDCLQNIKKKKMKLKIILSKSWAIIPYGPNASSPLLTPPPPPPPPPMKVIDLTDGSPSSVLSHFFNFFLTTSIPSFPSFHNISSTTSSPFPSSPLERLHTSGPNDYNLNKLPFDPFIPIELPSDIDVGLQSCYNPILLPYNPSDMLKCNNTLGNKIDFSSPVRLLEVIYSAILSSPLLSFSFYSSPTSDQSKPTTLFESSNIQSLDESFSLPASGTPPLPGSAHSLPVSSNIQSVDESFTFPTSSISLSAYLTRQSSVSHKTVILVENADIFFSDEKGFVSGMNELLRGTKKPIIITSNRFFFFFFSLSF
jgi:hypothetical protein